MCKKSGAGYRSHLIDSSWRIFDFLLPPPPSSYSSSSPIYSQLSGIIARCSCSWVQWNPPSIDSVNNRAKYGSFAACMSPHDSSPSSLSTRNEGTDKPPKPPIETANWNRQSNPSNFTGKRNKSKQNKDPTTNTSQSIDFRTKQKEENVYSGSNHLFAPLGYEMKFVIDSFNAAPPPSIGHFAPFPFSGSIIYILYI